MLVGITGSDFVIHVGKALADTKESVEGLHAIVTKIIPLLKTRQPEKLCVSSGNSRMNKLIMLPFINVRNFQFKYMMYCGIRPFFDEVYRNGTIAVLNLEMAKREIYG